jgi:hypothetical protein
MVEKYLGKGVNISLVAFLASLALLASQRGFLMEMVDLMHSLTMGGFSLVLAGCDAIEVRGPIENLTPQIKAALKEHKPTLLSVLGCEDTYAREERRAIQQERVFPPQNFDPADYAPPDYWEMTSEADRAYLTATPPRARCPWCGGISHHTKECFGQPRMPWGKFKDKPMSCVPIRYLTYVLRKWFGRMEHRRRILDELQRRYTRFRTEEWERYVIPEEQPKEYDERNALGWHSQGVSDHNHPLTRKGHVMARPHCTAIPAPQESKKEGI